MSGTLNMPSQFQVTLGAAWAGFHPTGPNPLTAGQLLTMNRVPATDYRTVFEDLDA